MHIWKLSYAKNSKMTIIMQVELPQMNKEMKTNKGNEFILKSKERNSSRYHERLNIVGIN